MSRLPRPGILFALMLIALFSAGLASAADKAQKEQKLKAVMQQIGKLKQAIDVKEDSKSRYITQLKSIERNIGKINRDIRAIGQNIKAKKSELDDLRKKATQPREPVPRGAGLRGFYPRTTGKGQVAVFPAGSTGIAA